MPSCPLIWVPCPFKKQALPTPNLLVPSEANYSCPSFSSLSLSILLLQSQPWLPFFLSLLPYPLTPTSSQYPLNKLSIPKFSLYGMLSFLHGPFPALQGHSCQKYSIGAMNLANHSLQLRNARNSLTFNPSIMSFSQLKIAEILHPKSTLMVDLFPYLWPCFCECGCAWALFPHMKRPSTGQPLADLSAIKPLARSPDSTWWCRNLVCANPFSRPLDLLSDDPRPVWSTVRRCWSLVSWTSFLTHENSDPLPPIDIKVHSFLSSAYILPVIIS